MPWAGISSVAIFIPSIFCASEAGGITDATMALAVSRSRPVGLPSWSRSMIPPSGFGVSRSMPATSSAFVLTQTLWWDSS